MIFKDLQPVAGMLGGGGILNVGYSVVCLLSVVFFDAFMVPSKFQVSSKGEELSLFHLFSYFEKYFLSQSIESKSSSAFNFSMY